METLKNLFKQKKKSIINNTVLFVMSYLMVFYVVQISTFLSIALQRAKLRIARYQETFRRERGEGFRRRHQAHERNPEDPPRRIRTAPGVRQVRSRERIYRQRYPEHHHRHRAYRRPPASVPRQVLDDDYRCPHDAYLRDRCFYPHVLRGLRHQHDVLDGTFFIGGLARHKLHRGAREHQRKAETRA